ncbi:hypothetical protein BJI69_03090 [Luteibacter rhizovicinus DSM 16549]|uniref:Uncharacterized protein n=1 Tax=Luteibacter rhizovicinus DSM 16549 TaxID=1440763 RepID=A0A1L3EPK2_9GAMM|nr:hypothetical protein [Luteibacter rhizovicinus]APG02989.1 hypothetical protein BJI69_03090 [Luteibacter rhizovicinus DSM 16549]
MNLDSVIGKAYSEFKEALEADAKSSGGVVDVVQLPPLDEGRSRPGVFEPPFPEYESFGTIDVDDPAVHMPTEYQAGPGGSEPAYPRKLLVVHVRGGKIMAARYVSSVMDA